MILPAERAAVSLLRRHARCVDGFFGCDTLGAARNVLLDLFFLTAFLRGFLYFVFFLYVLFGRFSVSRRSGTLLFFLCPSALRRIGRLCLPRTDKLQLRVIDLGFIAVCPRIL